MRSSRRLIQTQFSGCFELHTQKQGAGVLDLYPNVKWFKDAQRVVSTAKGHGEDYIMSEYVIHHFKPSDAGIYTCVFYNDRNETVEANTKLSM